MHGVLLTRISCTVGFHGRVHLGMARDGESKEEKCAHAVLSAVFDRCSRSNVCLESVETERDNLSRSATSGLCGLCEELDRPMEQIQTSNWGIKQL